MQKNILERLKNHWDYVVNLGYDESRFIGIFLYGSQNYNMANDNSDVNSYIITLPTFEDFCLKKEWLSKEIRMKNDEHIIIKDIRAAREMWLKQNINFLEILYSDYFILNPKYESLFNSYIKNNRDLIVKLDKKKAFTSICGQLLHTLNQDKTDNKKLYNGFRLKYFLQDFLLDLPYEDCIVPTGDIHDFLWKVKYECDWDNETKIQKADEIIEYVEKLMIANDKQIFSLNDSKFLDNGICEILKFSFNNDKNYSKKNFLNNLTNTETKALHSIFSEIHAEGNISLSKMIDRYSISRPVYNNLLSKLREYKMAEIVSQGVKGIYIKFIQEEIKAEAIDFL